MMNFCYIWQIQELTAIYLDKLIESRLLIQLWFFLKIILYKLKKLSSIVLVDFFVSRQGIYPKNFLTNATRLIHGYTNNNKRNVFKSHPYKYSTIFLLSLSGALKCRQFFLKKLATIIIYFIFKLKVKFKFFINKQLIFKYFRCIIYIYYKY